MRVEHRRFEAHYPAYPSKEMSWLPDLEAAHAGRRLKPGLVCPHRGASLEGIQPVDGVVTCPLDGLKWCVETGALVATRKWEV